MRKYKKSMMLIFILMMVSTTIVSAEAINKITINKILFADDRVYSDFSTNDLDSDFYTFLAFYRGNKLEKIKSIEQSSINGRYQIDEEVVENYDAVKIYFADKQTLSPIDDHIEILDSTNEQHTVTFVDESNSTLSSQNLLSGQTALSPNGLTKSGYIFAGWSEEYHNIVSGLILSPVFVDEADNNIFQLSSINTNAGESIEVTLSVDGTVNMCALEMTLKYDADKLEFVSSTAIGSLDPVANHIEDDSKIILNATSLSNKTSGMDILKLTFNVKDVDDVDTFVEISEFDNFRVACTDSEYNLYEADYNIINSIIRIR